MGSYPPQHYTPRGGKLYRNQLPSGSSVAEPVLDDFSSYTSQAEADAVYPTSSTTNFRVDVGSDNLKANFVNNTDDVIYRDLGSVSDSAFVLQFKWNITSYTAYSGGNSAQHGSIALSSGNGNMYEVNDGLGLYFNSNGSWTKAGYTDGANWVSPTMTGSNIFTPFVVTRWVRMTRESETSFKVQIFSDEYQTPIATDTITIPSSVTGLQYFSILSDSAPVSGTGDLRSTIDDFAFYDGVTSLETDPSVYPTYADDLAYSTQVLADASWVSNDTADFRVNLTNNNLAFDSKVTSTTNTGIYYDLGTALSDTEWIMDFKLVLTTLQLYSGGSVDGATYITMNNSGTGGAIGGVVDAIGLYMTCTATGGRWRMTNADSSPLNIAGGTLTTINATGTYYVRIIRLSSTSMRLELYSDSARENLIEGQTKTGISSGITGLRYIRIQDNQSSAGTGSGRQIGTIDDIKIYDGISSFS